MCASVIMMSLCLFGNSDTVETRLVQQAVNSIAALSGGWMHSQLGESQQPRQCKSEDSKSVLSYRQEGECVSMCVCMCKFLPDSFLHHSLTRLLHSTHQGSAANHPAAETCNNVEKSSCSIDFRPAYTTLVFLPMLFFFTVACYATQVFSLRQIFFERNHSSAAPSLFAHV